MRQVFILMLLFCHLSLLAWKPWPLPMDSVDRNRDSLLYSGSFCALASTGEFAPFLFSTNTDGVIGVSPFNAYLRARLEKSPVRDARWWDYSYGVDVFGGLDYDNWRTEIVKLYVHARLWCFDVTVGIKPFDMGNHDYVLSSGGFLFSRNAPSMPRISIGIDKYTPFPFTYGYMEIKGGITQGWFIDKIGIKNSLLHHKYLGVRFGGDLPININYEFHHVAQWGGISEQYGKLGSSIKDWWSVFKASSGGVMGNDQINAMGNHIGSQMLGLEFKYKGWYVNTYWQSLFEDGPIRYMWNSMNLYDGLWGVTIRQSQWKFISAITYEFLASTDQSGTVHDLDGIVFGGNDNYFNNLIYKQGWTHFSRTIGNPFITSPCYTSSVGVKNNRTFSHYIALKGDIYGFDYVLKYSHSDNFGTYDEPQKSFNNAIFVSVNKHVSEAFDLNFGIAFGCDFGTQFGNSFGAMLTISREGLIWTSKR